jgi:hypothetical protein
MKGSDTAAGDHRETARGGGGPEPGCGESRRLAKGWKSASRHFIAASISTPGSRGDAPEDLS